MRQTTAVNHYVPQAYLRQWSSNRTHISEHKLVVPRDNFPLWEEKAIRGVCTVRNLYDAAIPDHLVDHFELWLKREIEDPAYEVLRKAQRGDKLSRSDWSILVKFAVAQDVRTPEEYERYSFIEKHRLPGLLGKAVDRAVKEVNAGRAVPPIRRPVPADEELQLDVSVEGSDDGLKVELAAVVGSTSWMQQTKATIGWLSQRAQRHRWHLIRPCEGRSWPTSDHPVVRIKRLGPIFIYGTGWLQNGTEIFMPLSPQGALYTQVGSSRPVPEIASPEHTRLFVRALIGRAQRSVFADRDGRKLVEWESTRRVDLDEFNKQNTSNP